MCRLGREELVSNVMTEPIKTDHYKNNFSLSLIIKHHKTKLNHIPKRGIITDQLIRELFWGIWDEQQRQGDMCQSALKQDTWSKSARMTTSARRQRASLMCSGPFYSDPHNHTSPLIRKSHWKRSTDINPKIMHHFLPEVMIMIPDQKQSIWLWYENNILPTIFHKQQWARL